MIFLKYLKYTNNEGDKMKNLFLFISLTILTAFLVVNFSFEEKEQNRNEFKLITNNINVRVKRNANNSIELLPLEDYIVGVLAGEMPVSFEIEALKAQAVAARSYVLKRLIANRNLDYDILDTVSHQVYLDDNYLKERWKNEYINRINKLRKAVNETSGEIIMYNGDVADALYFSTSNGFTEDSEKVFNFELPYLRSVESSWDQDASPAFKYQTVMNLDEFYNKLQLPYQEKINIEIISRTESGRILEIKINNKTFKGTDVRQRLGIRSTDFNIVQDKKLISIDTKGYGHGVGMSQYGANGMALKGYKYKDILIHYYKGVLIKKI